MTPEGVNELVGRRKRLPKRLQVFRQQRGAGALVCQPDRPPALFTASPVLSCWPAVALEAGQVRRDISTRAAFHVRVRDPGCGDAALCTRPPGPSATAPWAGRRPRAPTLAAAQARADSGRARAAAPRVLRPVAARQLAQPRERRGRPLRRRRGAPGEHGLPAGTADGVGPENQPRF